MVVKEKENIMNRPTGDKATDRYLYQLGKIDTLPHGEFIDDYLIAKRQAREKILSNNNQLQYIADELADMIKKALGIK